MGITVSPAAMRSRSSDTGDEADIGRVPLARLPSCEPRGAPVPSVGHAEIPPGIIDYRKRTAAFDGDTEPVDGFTNGHFPFRASIWDDMASFAVKTFRGLLISH